MIISGQLITSLICINRQEISHFGEGRNQLETIVDQPANADFFFFFKIGWVNFPVLHNLSVLSWKSVEWERVSLSTRALWLFNTHNFCLMSKKSK